MEKGAAFLYQGENPPENNRGEQYRRLCADSSCMNLYKCFIYILWCRFAILFYSIYFRLLKRMALSLNVMDVLQAFCFAYFCI